MKRKKGTRLHTTYETRADINAAVTMCTENEIASLMSRLAVKDSSSSCDGNLTSSEDENMVNIYCHEADQCALKFQGHGWMAMLNVDHGVIGSPA